MPSIILPLVFLFFTNIFIEPTNSALPTYIQNLELDDFTSLWDKFPSIINKLKDAVNRFRCPKGWRRLGGSCYYLSNITSIPSEGNITCNFLHSNQSNLMQIRNTIELFYAAHVLTKYNLSSLMIDIDPNLLKGKTMANLLMEDQGRWQRMKDKFREIRVRYYKLKEKIVRELDDAGIRISRRSKKVKQSARKYKDKFRYDHNDPDIVNDYDFSGEQNITNYTGLKNLTDADAYEYDDIDSRDDNEQFENIEDIRGICDHIDWNVIDNTTTVYMLTTYLISDKIVCSLTTAEPDIEYVHLCEYVLDFCFANIVCGKHGRCVNTLSGFKCSCSFLYGGLLCEKISKQGKQIIIGFVIIFVLYGLSLKPIRWTLKMLLSCVCARARKHRHSKGKKKTKNNNETTDDKLHLVPTKTTIENDQTIEQPFTIQQRRRTLAEEFIEFLQEIHQYITLPKNVDPLKSPTKRDLVRLTWVGILSVIILSLLYSITTLTHFKSFKYEITDDTKLDSLVNDTVRLVMECERISNYRTGNLIFFPIALCLIFIFSWSIKREEKCLNLCDGRPGLIPPIEPFRTANRFTTATVFGILAFEVLKIFEELLFSTGDPLNHGVLVELLQRIAIVILIGLRYYPVLASLQLRNIVARFFACLYILGDIVYAIIREGSCMGFLPLSRYYSAIEEAKLRVELGTWFIIYGLIKNTPHFILLSYIGAELCVRFAYDSVYVPIKKKQSIWLSPVVQRDESEFAKYYVKKLFRRNLPQVRTNYSTDENLDKLDDYEHEAELQRKANQSRIRKFFDSIYQWDDDFRFTTIATCTYAVAIIFLYYLACTFVFLYISRTTGHLSFVRYYIETTLNIELKGVFSLRLEIIASAVITVMIYGFQLYIGMQNYKKHKIHLFRGIYEEVPSAANFTPNSIASKSVHYSGFLVGYMAWGFVICFHLIFFILSTIRLISLQLRYIELVLAICVPVLVVYLLKMVSTSTAGKFFFIQDMDDKLNLKNRKTYAIFVYFNFFADCFLGIASCIIRLIKATFLNVVYMARLDCSFLGRPLEKFDLGFAAYVSYLHMEVTHTNPIMLAFCYSLYDDVVQRRPKRCYDDECCIAPGELDNIVISQEEIKPVKNVTTKKTNQNGNGPSSKRTKRPTQEKSSSSTKTTIEKNKSIDSDDEQGLSIKETKSPSPSINSGKISQKSKQSKSNVDKNTKDKDDTEPSSPIISAVARLVPQQQPRLPPISPIPEAPIRKDLPPESDYDNEEDDDGGIKPSSISTISKAIPQQPPRLLPIQGSLPPRAPKRQDIDDNNSDDDDGGIDPKEIARRKQELEERKRKKEEAKKKKQTKQQNSDDDDDDGGITKTKPKNVKDKTKKPKVSLEYLDDEDDDGGISKQKKLEAQKKKEELKAKKKQREQQKSAIDRDNDEDDDGAPKRQTTTKTTKTTKKVSKPEILKEEDEDDDGGLIVKSFDTVRMIMPTKQPKLDNQIKKQQSPEATEDGSMMTSQRQSQPLLKSYDTVGRIIPKISTDNQQKKKRENHYDTIPTDEEHHHRSNVIYSPPSYDQASHSHPLNLLRTVSYREAQQSTPPLTNRRTAGSLSMRSHSTTNEDSSHYSEITTDTVPSGIINRSYSNTGSIQSSSNHSIKLQRKQKSEQTLKEEQQTEESTVESEQAEEPEEEEEEEEEEPEEEEKKPLPLKQKPLPNVSTAFSTISHLVNPDQARELEIIRRKKQARFRWFLAYTILNNYHLFDLRKQAQSRLALLRIQRSNLVNEQQYAAGGIPQAAPMRTTTIEITSATPDISVSPEQHPSATTRLLSVPVPVVDDYPQSPAERYITIRSAMLYDVNSQTLPIPRTPMPSATPSTISQQFQTLARTAAGARTLLPSVVVQPPSDNSSMRSKDTRPSYQRQASQHSSPLVINPLTGTPVFQAVAESAHSTGDYPLTTGSSITNFGTLRTQMSHAQHMQAWRENQIKKAHKNRSHCYFYGPPIQRPLEDKIPAAAILTPQVLTTERNLQQLPRNSPFRYPSQTQNLNEKQKNSKERRINSSSSSTTQPKPTENKSIKTNNKKPLRTTSALHRQDSKSSHSIITDV